MNVSEDHIDVIQIGGYPPPHGGVTIHVQELTRRLWQRSISCRVLSNCDPQFQEPPVPDVLRFHGGRIHQFSGILKAAVAMRPRIVHVHMAYGVNALPWAAAFACVPGTTASILTVHSGLFPAVVASRSRSSRYLWGRCLRMFSLLIAVNSDIADAAAGLGVPSAKIRVIPAYFPPDSSVGEPCDSALSVLRRRCGVLLFTSGFLHADWGLLSAARSLSAISDLRPGLIIVHSGATDDGYVRQVKSAVLDEGRLLLYGELPHDEFLGRLAAADIYIRASLYDGDSLAVREALDLGKSVIASDCAPRPAGCILFRAGSQASLDQALQRVARQPRSTSPGQPQPGSAALLEIYESLLTPRHAGPQPARV